MIYEGLKFGMLLQLAVGPVCLFVFQTGSSKGFVSALFGVLAVTLTDAAFVLLALFGITSFIHNENVKQVFKSLGALIVGLFGINIIIGSLGLIIPDINLLRGMQGNHPFVAGLILTASNPLTVLFWAGVFSAKISEDQLYQKDVYLFGLGAVLATLIFLTAVALLGSFTQQIIPKGLVKILNLIVGFSLLYFAVKMVSKKNQVNP